MQKELKQAHLQMQTKKQLSLFNRFKKQWELQIFAVIGLVWMIIFCYLPMGGLIIAFKDYSILSDMWSAPWAGFTHFREFLGDENFISSFKNTLGISLYKLLVSMPVPILFAILLNEVTNLKYKKLVQTVSYLPHFLSWVIIGGIMTSWFSEGGMINKILIDFGISNERVAFLAEPKYFWNIAVFSDLWQDYGWSSIIYFAAISGIDQTLYEAAGIDGAGRFRKIWHITLPCIKSTIVILFILKVGYLMNSNFDQIMVLTNPLNRSASEVIDVFVYRLGINMQRFSYATAVGLVKSIIALVLLAIANTFSKKLTDSSLY